MMFGYPPSLLLSSALNGISRDICVYKEPQVLRHPNCAVSVFSPYVSDLDCIGIGSWD